MNELSFQSIRLGSNMSLAQVLEFFPGEEWSDLLMLDLPKISRSGLEGAPLDDELEDVIVDFISLHSQKDEASGCYHFFRSDIVEYCGNLAVSRNLLLFFNGEPSLSSLAAACYEYDELWMDLVGSAGVISEVKKNLGGEVLSVGDFSVDEWVYSEFVGECIAQLKQSFESPKTPC